MIVFDPLKIPLDEEVIRQTHPATLALIKSLLETIQALQLRVEQLEKQNAKLQSRVAQLEARLEANSSSFSRPPSSDSSFQAKPSKISSGKRGGKQGHKDYRQPMVEPTNNHAERLLRFAVTWRKSSLGTASRKGERFVERILSLRHHTCRLKVMRLYLVLVEALNYFFRRAAPDLSWITRLKPSLCDCLLFYYCEILISHPEVGNRVGNAKRPLRIVSVRALICW